MIPADSDITKAAAEIALELEIPDVYFSIARALDKGISPSGIGKVFDYPIEEVTALLAEPDFMRLKSWYSELSQRRSLDSDDNWDSLEGKAIHNLGKIIEHNRDPDFNLKVASVANRAQRRHRAPTSTPLDPNNAGKTVNISFQKRFVKVLENGYVAEEMKIEASGLSQFEQADLATVSAMLGVSDKVNGKLDDPAQSGDRMVLAQMLEDGVIEGG